MINDERPGHSTSYQVLNAADYWIGSVDLSHLIHNIGNDADKAPLSEP